MLRSRSAAMASPPWAPMGIAGALCIGVYRRHVHFEARHKQMTHKVSWRDRGPTPKATGSARMLKSADPLGIIGV